MNTLFTVSFIILVSIVCSAPVSEESQHLYADYKRPHATGYPRSTSTSQHHKRGLLSVVDEVIPKVLDAFPHLSNAHENNMPYPSPGHTVSKTHSTKADSATTDSTVVHASVGPEQDLMYEMYVKSS